MHWSRDYPSALTEGRELLFDGAPLEYRRGIAELLARMFPRIDVPSYQRIKEVNDDLKWGR
jgi:hypothetical protein